MSKSKKGYTFTKKSNLFFIIPLLLVSLVSGGLAPKKQENAVKEENERHEKECNPISDDEIVGTVPLTSRNNENISAETSNSQISNSQRWIVPKRDTKSDESFGSSDSSSMNCTNGSTETGRENPSRERKVMLKKVLQKSFSTVGKEAANKEQDETNVHGKILQSDS